MKPKHSKATLADLKRSGLNEKDARRLGIESLAPAETRELVAGKASGWKDKGSEYEVEAYKIPYLGIDGRPTKFYRLRFLGEVKDKHGKPQRYWQPPGSGCHFYLAPGANWKKIARDPARPLYITEGEKKAAALCKLGFPCVGVGGVDNWKSDGRPIDDFNLFGWKNRRAILVFDSDRSKYDVQRALRALADQLIALDAVPEEVELPGLPGDPKVGADDFIVKHGKRAKKAFQALPRRSLLMGELLGTEGLVTARLPEPKWAIEGLITEGATMLVGAPKIGKSWLMLHLAIAVMTGGKALGTYQARAGNVLYLGFEDTLRRLQDRIKRLLDGAPIPRRGEFTTRWRQPDDHGLVAIERWLDAHPDARLVVIDTLHHMRRARQKGGQLYDEDYEAIRALRDVAVWHHVAIVVVHHTSKRRDADDPLDLASGSTGLTGACDSILVLKRGLASDAASLHIRGRDIDPQDLALEFDLRTCRWESKGDAADHRMSEERREIVSAVKELKRAGHPTKPSDVASALGKKRPAVQRLMLKMVQSGELHWLGDGQYEYKEEEKK